MTGFVLALAGPALMAFDLGRRELAHRRARRGELVGAHLRQAIAAPADSPPDLAALLDRLG